MVQKLGFHTSPAWVTGDVEDGGGGSVEDDCDASVFLEARDEDDEVRHGEAKVMARGRRWSRPGAVGGAWPETYRTTTSFCQGCP